MLLRLSVYSTAAMIKSVLTILRKSLADSRLCYHTIKPESKRLPQILSDATSVDEFQYFSMKIKDLMDKEQLEYFENVIRKVEKINHPIAELMNAKLHNPILDLTMLSVTEVMNGDVNDKELFDKQQSLSNAIQLIHIGNLVHQKGIFDLSKVEDFGNSLPPDHELILGNKVALLAGDFLLANAQMKITLMRNDVALRIISSALCDIIDSNFIGEHDEGENPLPFMPSQIPRIMNDTFEQSLEPMKLDGTSGTAEDEWMIRNILYRGSLVAKGCQTSAVIANQPVNVQKISFELGKYFYLTWQAASELEPYRGGSVPQDFKISLISAPVLFHLNHDPAHHETIIKESKSSDGIDYVKLFETILNGPGVERTEKLIRKLKNETQSQLMSFPTSIRTQKIERILSDFEYV